MKLIYVYRKLGINDFLVNLRVVKDFIFLYIYIYIYFGGGGGVCRGIKKTNPLVTQSVRILCVFNNK